MKERENKSASRTARAKSDINPNYFTAPDTLSEYRPPEDRHWKNPEFGAVDAELRRYVRTHYRKGLFPSADIQNYANYSLVEPHILILDVTPHPLDFRYSVVGAQAELSNERPLLGISINELRTRNYKKYGIYGHQAEMYCMFMDAHLSGDIYTTSRNMTVCVDEFTNQHKTKDIDISAVRASSNGIFPDKIVAVTMIRTTKMN